MGIEDDFKRFEEKQKFANLQIDKRLAQLETIIENLRQYISRGQLTPQQEQRVADLEERMGDIEDLQMLNRLDILQIKDAIKKISTAPIGMLGEEITPAADISGLESRMAALEQSLAAGGESKVASMDLNIHKMRLDDLERVTKEAVDEIGKLKSSVENFREENNKKFGLLINALKRIAEGL